ncbi:MAG: hypothetical protein R3E89_15520, partial [Thiolinea sp.]
MTKTIFIAKNIITLNPSMPQATHIAVADGRIQAVGPWEAVSHLQGYAMDERFKDQTILPGFVEGHSHALEGAMWDYLYLGYFARTDPTGKQWPGVTSR